VIPAAFMRTPCTGCTTADLVDTASPLFRTPSPKVNRQDLHLDKRADETGPGEFRGLRPRLTQGEFPRTAQGLQHGNKARHVSRQAKPRGPMCLQQSLSNVLGRDGATVLLAPSVQAVPAASFGAPAESATIASPGQSAADRWHRSVVMTCSTKAMNGAMPVVASQRPKTLARWTS
jgi:hypothetical protein